MDDFPTRADEARQTWSDRMTPNKLPPLPGLVDSLESMSGRASDFSWDCTVVALDSAVNLLAEALRQSQSLPAGAVAGLVGKWRGLQAIYADRANRATDDRDAYADSSTSDAYEECADLLEQALQADAREKGEACCNQEYAVPFYAACERAASDLPEGWEIRICLESGSGTVELVDPDGEVTHMDEDAENRMTAEVHAAIDTALATHPAQASENVRGEATGDTTTFKDAWARLSPIDRSVISSYFKDTSAPVVAPPAENIVGWLTYEVDGPISYQINTMAVASRLQKGNYVLAALASSQHGESKP